MLPRVLKGYNALSPDDRENSHNALRSTKAPLFSSTETNELKLRKLYLFFASITLLTLFIIPANICASLLRLVFCQTTAN